MNFIVQEPRNYIPDTYVSGLANIDHIGGGTFRFTFYAVLNNQPVIRARILMNIEAVPAAMMMTARELGIDIAVSCPTEAVQH